MLRSVRNSMDTPSLLQLPDAAIYEVLRHLDARSLVMLEQSNSYFSRKEPTSRLPLVEHVARESVHQLCASPSQAERFRYRSWRERLYLEQGTGVGFDHAFSDGGGFRFQLSEDGAAIQSVRLTGMGPKLLVSDLSTRHQPVLRWQLRVKGNTAVEFGVIPADLPPTHTALHKCMSAPGCPQHRAMGFCSQITAGSLLPLKAPVMRGTVLDVVARRGHLEVVLDYPEDAKEISWLNGQPVQRPYRGPSQLRFEQDFPPDYDVRLAVTSWAKAHFEVLHTGYALDPEWAVATTAAQASDAADAAAADAADAQAPAAPLAHPQLLPEALLEPAEPELAVAAAEEEDVVEVEVEEPPILPLPHEQQQHLLLLQAAQQAAGELPAHHQQQQQQQQQQQAAAVAAAMQQMVAGAVQAAAQDAAAAVAAEAAAGAGGAAQLHHHHHHHRHLHLAAGLQAEPLALAAAAVGEAAGDFAPLAVLLPGALHLQEQHHHQQQQAAGVDVEAAAGVGSMVGQDAAPLSADSDSEGLEELGLALALGLDAIDTTPAADAAAVVAAAGVPEDALLAAAGLCHSPSGELCQDGHLHSPSA